MLTVTEAAKEYLKETLEAQTKDSKACTRLILMPPHFEKINLMLDVGGTNNGDQVIEYDGVIVMAVAPELKPVLDGVTLDVKDTDQGRQLVITKLSN